jgi:2-(1,2-epoxy-1,2-dihydrophenyl)acetyl-CoA isomerase
MADLTTLLYSLDKGVARITLNRPDRYNAFNNAMSAELNELLKQVARDPEVRVVVITGAGEKAFCSGQDLKDAAATAGTRNLGDSVERRYNPMIRGVIFTEKPFIARLNGAAAGAGAGLALACDFVVASEESYLLFAFANIGLVLDSGTSYTLPRLVGMRKAIEYAILGEKIPAQQALVDGLINRVVPAAELDAATDALAERLAAAPTKAVGYIKKMLHASLVHDLNHSLTLEKHYQELAGSTHDASEGVMAFIEKRKPVYKGK